MADHYRLIWGSKDPKKKPPPRLVLKDQEVYSETNYNLWLDFDAEDADCGLTGFDLAQLVIALGYSGGPYGHVRLLEEGHLSSLCDNCREDLASPCQLFVKPQPRGWAQDASFPAAVRSLMQKDRGPCPILGELASMAETEEERRFYELYLDFAFRKAQRSAYQTVKGVVGDPDQRPLFVGYDLVCALGLPALLPQVVLNFVRAADLPDGHPDRHFFDSNAGRVDFVFVQKGERHIVEIDGPVHHATEKGYTRNLRIDRTLRHQGWQVHRFSNLEVREAKDFRQFAWELGFT